MADILPAKNPNAADEPWLRPELVAPWWEIAVVVLLVIGQSSLMSTWQAWNGSSRHYVTDLATNGRMLHTLSIECPLLGLLFIYLNRAGLATERFPDPPHLARPWAGPAVDTGHGGGEFSYRHGWDS